MTSEQKEQESLRKLPVPMPPMLPEVIGLTSDCRYFSLSYEGGKAWWTDGRAGRTFSYYAAYQPYVEHFAIGLHLLGMDLGSDDGPPTHALLVDRQAAEVYVGEYDEVWRWLKTQHPPRQPLTPAEIEEAERQQAAWESATLDELRELGMFEFMLSATEGQKDKCWAMVAWLDDFITEDLLKAYLAASEAENIEALHHLLQFQRRMAAHQQTGADSRFVH